MTENHEGAERRVAEVLRSWKPLAGAPSASGSIDDADDDAQLLAALARGGATVDELARHLGLLRAAMPGAQGDDSNDRQVAGAIVAALAEPDGPAVTAKSRGRSQRTDSDEGSYICPCCSEQVVVPLDRTAGDSQRYVEDCPVCCNPVQLEVEFFDGDEPPRIRAEAE